MLIQTTDKNNATHVILQLQTYWLGDRYNFLSKLQDYRILATIKLSVKITFCLYVIPRIAVNCSILIKVLTTFHS